VELKWNDFDWLRNSIPKPKRDTPSMDKLYPFIRPRPPTLSDYMPPNRPSQRRRVNRLRANLRGARRTTRGRVRSYTAYTRTKTRSNIGLLGGSDADVRRVYTRSRMPLRKKRRWRRFVKKVNAVSEKDLGSRTVLFNDSLVQVNRDPLYPQSALTLSLYGAKSSSQWLSDTANIAGYENTLNPSAAAGSTVYNSTKYLFQSGVFDVTIRNVSTLRKNDTTDPLPQPVYELDGRAAIELDVYECYHRKLPTKNNIIPQHVSQIMDYSDDPEIGGTGSGINIQSRGATPFEFGKQMGMTGLKIMKKTKYFIPNGQTITHQIRDPKRHVFSREEMDNASSYAHPGVTRILYFVYKFVPGIDKGSLIGQFTLELAIGVTRKYMYKIEGVNESRERSIGATYAPNITN